jgi:hypothetical protein
LFSNFNPTYVLASSIDESIEEEAITDVSEESEEVLFEGEEENSEDPTREDAIAEILAMNPEDATDPTIVVPEYEETTYTKDVTFSQATLQGIFSSTEIFFYVPDYWETEYVYAEIQYDLSQLIEDVVSSMTFSVNNTPIESTKISYDAGNTQITYIKIPMELVNEGYNSFTISTYARLYDEEGCIDDFSGANWCSIADTSYIRCGYEIKDDEHKISYYPYPFMSTIEDTGKGLTIAVSDKATDGELEAAMNIMADLSSYTGEENNIQFCLLSDMKNTNPERTILISNYNNLTQEYKNKMAEETVDEEHALVNFIDDSNGNPMLLITSLNDDCLLEAAYMLMDDNRVSQERTNLASVNLGSAEIAINSTSISQMIVGNYTIKDIMGSGMTFYGPFHQEQNIYLPFSEDYFLSDAGKLSLKFRYSDNLDFTRSMITVYWGDVPIASKKLEQEKATGDTLTFAMPADVVGTTAGSIRIAFDLEIQDLICSPRQDQMPWAYVSEESTLFLPASTGIVLTFDLKPSPFRTDGKFNNLMLVIPEEPTTEELNLFAQVIGMYGEGVDPYGTFYVRRQSEFDEKDADYNIITIGTYEDNTLLQKINENLHFSYNEAGDGFLSNEQLILSDVYASEIAILQLLESPYAVNRGVLAITGVNEESLSYVQEFMRDYDKRFSLSKDCVLVDSDLNIKAFQFIEELDETEQPSMLVILANNKQSLLFTIVATSIMLMILIAVIIILIRIRMYHKSKEE